MVIAEWLLRRGVSLLLRVAPGSIPGGLIIFCWCLILHGGMALFGWVLNFACCMALFGWARAEARHAAWRGLGWRVATGCFNVCFFGAHVCFFGARVWSLDALQPILPFDFLARATARCFCRSAFGRPFVILLGLFNTRSLLACSQRHFSSPRALLPHLFLH